MEEAIKFINEVGFPIAAAGGLGWFIYKLVIRIVDGMEAKLDIVDEKVAEQIEAMEQMGMTESIYMYQHGDSDDDFCMLDDIGSACFGWARG